VRRIALTLIGLMLIAGTATAHVTVKNPKTAVGARGTFTVGVPNERPDSATVSVALRIPAGFRQVKPVARAGWKAAQQRQGGMTVITWSGGRVTGTADVVFRFTALAPQKAGPYRIPSLQTYEDGEVVRWIGPEDTEFPAPVITIGAGGKAAAPAKTERHTIAPGEGSDTAAAPAEPQPTTTAADPTETTETTAATDTTTDTTAAGAVTQRKGPPVFPIIIAFVAIALIAIVGTFAYRRQHRAVRDEAETAEPGDDLHGRDAPTP